MAEFYDRSSMEFESYPCDTPVLSPEDATDPLVRLDSPKGFERFSFSVVYQAFDFPFPLIHYPHQSPDSLDSQFSVGCVHGGGSMLSSLDVSVESCLDAATASSKCSDISVVMSHPKEDSSEFARLPPRMTNGSLDEESSLSVSKVVMQQPSSSMFSSPLRSREYVEASIPPKEPNPVEFRSGYRGVSWNRRMKAWLAFWSEGKNRRSKTFNAKVMGFEKARSAAIDFLKKKKQFLQQMDPNFVDYDEYDYEEDQTSNGIPPSGASSFDELNADIHSTSTGDTTTAAATPSVTPCGSSEGTIATNTTNTCSVCGNVVIAHLPTVFARQQRLSCCLYCGNSTTP